MKVHHFAPWKGHFYRLGCVKGLGFKLLPDSQRGRGVMISGRDLKESMRY